MPLASLSFTHVHYNPSDPISYLCAWLALVPQGLCVTYITLMIATREAEIILLFAGQMGCEVLNFMLKRFLKEERPKYFVEMNGKGYGMPSSHAQFMAFFSVSLTLFLFLRQRTNATKTPPILSFVLAPIVEKSLISLVTLIAASLIALSRIYLGYHSPRQVLVGFMAGIVSAVAWFIVTGWARREGWINWVLDLEVVRPTQIRDLVVEEDVWESGWRVWEVRRLERNRNKISRGPRRKLDKSN